jgi:hypothetical protein
MKKTAIIGAILFAATSAAGTDATPAAKRIAPMIAVFFIMSFRVQVCCFGGSFLGRRPLPPIKIQHEPDNTPTRGLAFFALFLMKEKCAAECRTRFQVTERNSTALSRNCSSSMQTHRNRGLIRKGIMIFPVTGKGATAAAIAKALIIKLPARRRCHVSRVEIDQMF